jgi:hypothetical protein
MLEAIFASSLGTALAFDRPQATLLGKAWAPRTMQLAIVLALFVRLVASERLEPYLILFSPSYRANMQESVTAMAHEIERVSALPEPLHCSIDTVCYRAGKKLVYDSFFVAQQIATKHWTIEQVQAAIGDQGIRFEPVADRVQPPKMRLLY